MNQIKVSRKFHEQEIKVTVTLTDESIILEAPLDEFMSAIAAKLKVKSTELVSSRSIIMGRKAVVNFLNNEVKDFILVAAMDAVEEIKRASASAVK